MTPKIIAKLQNCPEIACCIWCGDEASLAHCLLWCPCVCKIHAWANISSNIEEHEWILGASNLINPLIWVINFAKYKTFLKTTSGFRGSIYQVVKEECSHFERYYPQLTSLDHAVLV